MNIYELSTYPFIIFGKNSPTNINEFSAAIILEANNISNYGLLQEKIDENHPDFQLPYLKFLLAKGYESLEKYNNRAITAPIFTFDTYGNSGLDTSLLNSTDSVTSCEVLPFTSPLTTKQPLAERLKPYSIKDAKEMLSKYASESKNGLEMCVASFGHCKSYEVTNLIKFYENQIVRTAEELPDLHLFSGSLFTYNFKTKRTKVSQYSIEMCQYLLDGTSEYIWGKMDESKKVLLQRRIKSPADKKDLNTYLKFLDTIASYTTMSDLENSLTRKRAMERFIIK